MGTPTAAGSARTVWIWTSPEKNSRGRKYPMTAMIAPAARVLWTGRSPKTRSMTEPIPFMQSPVYTATSVPTPPRRIA